MNALFADTSFYIAFCNPKDSWHLAATSFAADYSGMMFTTEFVLVEFANCFRTPQNRGLFLRFHGMLRKDAKTVIEAATSSCIQDGLSLYAARPDKHWSLTDCISMAVMQKHDLTEALTTDHHFEQGGYRILLS